MFVKLSQTKTKLNLGTMCPCQYHHDWPAGFSLGIAFFGIHLFLSDLSWLTSTKFLRTLIVWYWTLINSYASAPDKTIPKRHQNGDAPKTVTTVSYIITFRVLCKCQNLQDKIQSVGGALLPRLLLYYLMTKTSTTLKGHIFLVLSLWAMWYVLRTSRCIVLYWVAATPVSNIKV